MIFCGIQKLLNCIIMVPLIKLTQNFEVIHLIRFGPSLLVCPPATYLKFIFWFWLNDPHKTGRGAGTSSEAADTVATLGANQFENWKCRMYQIIIMHVHNKLVVNVLKP